MIWVQGFKGLRVEGSLGFVGYRAWDDLGILWPDAFRGICAGSS